VPARTIALAVLVAALGGGVVGALVERATGWSARERTEAVVINGPAARGLPPEPAAARTNAASTLDAARLYAARAPGVVTIYSFFGPAVPMEGHAAQGSGFVVSRQGDILTNAHVVTTAPSSSVTAADSVVVEFADGDRTRARIVGWDAFSDVALLKVDPKAHRLRPVPLGDSAHLVVGQPVAAIGTPFGNQNSLTVGVVSGTRRSISSLTSDYEVSDAIQTDAPINRGNSGGPLFDAAGRVIGINAQIRSDTGVNEGVGFAIPIDLARHAMADLLAHGRVRYAYMGVSAQDLTPSVARLLGYDVSRGAVLACIEPGSPADRAGLEAGSGSRLVLGRRVARGADVVVAVNGDRVTSGSDLVRIVSQELRPGKPATVTVVRGHGRRQFRLVLAQRPSRPSGRCG
jgi:S1-C subfamily serine protease